MHCVGADVAAVQARAAAASSAADDVSGIARLAQREVATLQGQLADLDRKNADAVSAYVGALCTLACQVLASKS